MKVTGFAGFSGSGKTTLLTQLVPQLRAAGLRVAVLKHAHHRFDIDQPGKDSWRHRQAGAFEVLLASEQRWALMREYERAHPPEVHELLAQFDASVDWVLVEGFKEAQIPKVEVWRPAEPGQAPRPVRYPHDACVVAIATSAAQALPEPSALPVFDLNAAHLLGAWLLEHASRFDYPGAAVAAARTQAVL